MKKVSKSSTSHGLLRLNTSQYRREYKSGAVYLGELEGNKKNGKGIFKWPNGACYDGEYVDNARYGPGKQYWPDGSIYIGEFVRDYRHGFGTLTWPDGESYTGQFHHDRKHGEGEYTWPDGTTFKGHFENDKKEGFGTFTFPSGNVFQGIYKRDERDGPGVITYSNNEEDLGLWSGERLIKLCSVMESAFLFQHYSDYNVNAGHNLSGKVRRANTAREGTRNSPSLVDFEGASMKASSKLMSQMPGSFPYLDILEGVRVSEAQKGPIECASEDLLRSAAAGDCVKVQTLIQSGKVHVDVGDKTGYTALLAASVNCHRDVINCLLDNGANVNKLNDEGLSVLAACHVLFYTKHTWKDNIAENIPEENLFNCIQEDCQKGVYVHRNFRQTITTEDVKVETNLEHDEEDTNTEDEHIGNTENVNNKNEVEDQRKYRIIEFTDNSFKDNDDTESENGLINETRTGRTDFAITGFQKDMLGQDKNGISGLDNYTNSKTSSPGRLSPGRLSPVNGNLSFLEKTGDPSGKLNVGTSLFSVLSVVSSTRQQSESEDVCSENSLEQNKQVLLAVQRRPHLEATVRLLLKRGADPNASSLPMPVLFFAVKAADTAAVEILLQKGADTSAKLSKEKLGITPLHIAVALPDDTGVEITELLLKAGANPSVRDSAFEGEDNGRTPAHIACSQDNNDKVSCAVVRLLLEYGANPDLLCEGHSALSLAICSGNDMAVDKLLEHGANPSLRLSRGVGSALCAATSFMAERRRTPAGRIKLINKLMKAGANILSPITVNFKYPPGTVVDYAYNVFYQDRKIAHTPYHALTVTERDCYNARREMLDHLGDILRTHVLKKEKELIDKQLAEAEKQDERAPRSAWGILKTHATSPAGGKENMKSPLVGTSRVSFHIENEVFTPRDGETREIEAQADREVQAITGTDRESAGGDSEEEQIHNTSQLTSGPGESTEGTPCSFGSSAPEMISKPSSPGRDENCGLRIAVTKAADHMSISALATQALKQRYQVMKNRFRYCYECGRSIGIRLSACTRCKEVFYCSKSCKLKAWNARHREECVRLTGGVKTAASRRSESPTPTTDPDALPYSTTPSGSGRKGPSRIKGEKNRKTLQSHSRAPSRRTTTPWTTKSIK